MNAQIESISAEMSSVSASELELHEDFLKLLSARFHNNDYYTWLDLVLISINPLRDFPNTASKNKALREALKENSLIRPLEPHIYSVVHRALCCLSVNRIDQIIVISGDSGSGKTHAAEEALNFIADTNTPLSQIRHSQTLLSCFGNAATEYHGNSSRFGNLLVLNYSEFSKTILKARIRTYLLEKTRVSSPSVRNFHIFYQLLAACKLSKQDDLHLNIDKKFRVLPGQVTVEDENGFRKMIEAFVGLNCDWSLIKNIFEVIAGILHLGNIVFTSRDDSSSHIDVNYEESFDDLQKACELLGLDSENLALLLTNSVISFNKHDRRTIQIPVTTLRDATTRRDALMKLLYLLLFNWIVSFINKKFDRENSVTTFKLGLLDIYGFEMFSRNSLEQLCINYANERLHNYFIKDIIIRKKKMLKEEGILLEYEYIQMGEDYSKESTARINLIDAQTSVFSIINEGSLLIQHCEGKEVCQKLKNLPKNDLMQVDSYSEKFAIKHFAGNVTYNSNHMVEKNSDKVPNELIDILLNSSKRFLIQLVTDDRSHSLKHTVLGKFKRCLDLLITELDNAQVHYVRCIKPNVQMKPDVIDKPFFEKQLRSSGVMEAVQLCGHCLPVRLNLETFFNHFGCLMSNSGREINSVMDDLICFKKWADNLQLKYHIGDSESIFLEEDDLIDLEKKVNFLREHSTRVIQKAWRSYRQDMYCSRSSFALMAQRDSNLFNSQESYSNSLEFNWLSPYYSPTNTSQGDEEMNPSRLILNFNCDIRTGQHPEDIGCRRSIEASLLRNKLTSTFQQILSTQDPNIEREELNKILQLIGNKPNLHSSQTLPSLYNTIDLKSPNSLDGMQTDFKAIQEELKSDSSILTTEYPILANSRSYSSKSNLRSAKTSERLENIRNIKEKKLELAENSRKFDYNLLRKIEISTRKFGGEIFFIGNGVVSRRALAKVPIWFHTKTTCIPYSYTVPFSELPHGVEDAFE